MMEVNAVQNANHMELHGNQQTMNLENILYMNILSSPYFKDLLQLKTYHEVLEEIKTKVAYIGPWVPGAAKTPSTSFVLLFKLFTLKLTVKQLTGMLNSPLWSLRGVAFLYLRYTCPPKKLWEWLEPYLEDEDDMCIYQKLPTVQTKVLLRKFIKDHKYEETLFPRIPVPVQKDMLKKLEEHDKMFQQDTDQSGYGDQGNQAEEYEPPERRDRDYRDNKRRRDNYRRSRSPPRRREERRKSRSPRRDSRRSRSPRDRRDRSRSRSPKRNRSRSPRRDRSRSPRRDRRDRSGSRSPKRANSPPKAKAQTQESAAALQKIKALYGATTSTKFDETKSKKDSMSGDTILLGSFQRKSNPP